MGITLEVMRGKEPAAGQAVLGFTSSVPALAAVVGLCLLEPRRVAHGDGPTVSRWPRSWDTSWDGWGANGGSFMLLLGLGHIVTAGSVRQGLASLFPVLSHLYHHL